VFSVASYSVVITVPDDYATIQAAIDSAVDGDEIIVSPATYVENIHFKGKNIILRSTDPTDSDTVAATIIDGNQSGSVVTFFSTETPDCILSGFTITNGDAEYGCGINGNLTRATIRNSVITFNTSTSGESGESAGGGLSDCNGIIEYNTISGNSAGTSDLAFGGGLARCDGTIRYNTISGNIACFGAGLFECRGKIYNNLILHNSTASWGEGGGLWGCSGIILNNVIAGNVADHYGGGLYECRGTILNNTVTGNTAGRDGGGLHRCRGAIVNCIIWANSASGDGNQLDSCSEPVSSCIQDWTDGENGNIASTPNFVDVSDGNFHLASNSPCINAGNPEYLEYLSVHSVWLGDIDGECRMAGQSVDMGCDEFGSSADTDGDLLSDVDEITYGTDPENADTDGDGAIDGLEVIWTTDPTVAALLSEILVPNDMPSIQAALMMAAVRATIVVAPGTYPENIQFMGRDVVLRSTDPADPGTVAATIIDGRRFDTVVTFSGGETPDCILSGFTITNGRAHSFAGIRGCGTMATIENNVISGNTAIGGAMFGGFGSGGGLGYCAGVVQNNVISNNSARVGGGASCCGGIFQNNTVIDNKAGYLGGGIEACNGIIQNNIISGNSASGHGGGLSYCDGTIQNNLVFGNSAPWGVGGGLQECDGDIENNTIWNNYARNGGGGLAECQGTIKNCIIWQNTRHIYDDTVTYDDFQLYDCVEPSYSCIQDWTGVGQGNIMDEPQLVDPENGNFHLFPISPCVDAGTYIDELIEDFEGDPRPIGAGFDIGADESAVGAIDTDNDGMPDFWEMRYSLDWETDDANGDADNDGLTNSDEYVLRTDPQAEDSDGDTMPDGWESDYGLNPLVDDAEEDPDSDGLTNGDEYSLGTDPHSEDTDGDLMPDGWEVDAGLDPVTNDAAVDADSDGVANGDEYAAGTNPLTADTDGDGYTDGEEIEHGGDPIDGEAIPAPWLVSVRIMVLDGPVRTGVPQPYGVAGEMRDESAADLSAADIMWTVVSGVGEIKKTYPIAAEFVSWTASESEVSVTVELDGEVQTDTIRLLVEQRAAGDADLNGFADAVDIQLVINRVLGISTPGICDMDGDGRVDAVDVQLIILAVLGIPVGP